MQKLPSPALVMRVASVCAGTKRPQASQSASLLSFVDDSSEAGVVGVVFIHSDLCFCGRATERLIAVRFAAIAWEAAKIGVMFVEAYH